MERGNKKVSVVAFSQEADIGDSLELETNLGNNANGETER